MATASTSATLLYLVDVSDSFYLARGEGGVRGAGGGRGAWFFLENPGGGVSRRGGAEGLGGSLQRIGELGGGGAKYFFRGRNAHQAAKNPVGKLPLMTLNDAKLR